MGLGSPQTQVQEQSVCNDSIQKHIVTDIRNENFLNDSVTNIDACNSLYKQLSRKYSWLSWVVYVYSTQNSKDHWSFCKNGPFWSIPKTGNRNIIAIPVDKNGKYVNQKYKVYNALKKVIQSAKAGDYGWKSSESAQGIHCTIKRELEKKGVWIYVESMSLLKNTEGGFHLDHHYSPASKYVSEKITLFSHDQQKQTIYILIVLRQMKSIT